MKIYFNTKNTIQVIDKNTNINEKEVKKRKLFESDKDISDSFERVRDKGTKKVLLNKDYLQEIIKIMGKDKVMEFEVIGGEIPVKINTKNFSFFLAPIKSESSIEETEDKL